MGQLYSKRFTRTLIVLTMALVSMPTHSKPQTTGVINPAVEAVADKSAKSFIYHALKKELSAMIPVYFTPDLFPYIQPHFLIPLPPPPPPISITGVNSGKYSTDYTTIAQRLNSLRQTAFSVVFSHITDTTTNNLPNNLMVNGVPLDIARMKIVVFQEDSIYNKNKQPYLKLSTVSPFNNDIKFLQYDTIKSLRPYDLVPKLQLSPYTKTPTLDNKTPYTQPKDSSPSAIDTPLERQPE